MTDHPKCATCKHWLNKEIHSKSSGRRKCEKMPYIEDAMEWDEDRNRILMPKYKDIMAFCIDVSGYHAQVDTSPDFYCAMHSELTIKKGSV